MTGTAMPTRSQRLVGSLRQFVKFGIVGGSGVVVNMIVAIIMHRLHGGTVNGNDPLLPLPFTDGSLRYRHLVWIVAFLVANMTNFQLNRTWTFKSSRHAPWWSEFLPFLAVGSVAALAGLFILSAFTNTASPLYLPDPYFNETAGLRSREYWAQLLTIVITMPINFVVNKLWTFRAVRTRSMLGEGVSPDQAGLVPTAGAEQHGAEPLDDPRQAVAKDR